eukprot:6197833-Pleurochrysis_carterae.AAC.3
MLCICVYGTSTAWRTSTLTFADTLCVLAQVDDKPLRVPICYWQTVWARNFRHPASMTYSPTLHWESGDRMAPLNISIHYYST